MNSQSSARGHGAPRPIRQRAGYLALALLPVLSACSRAAAAAPVPASPDGLSAAQIDSIYQARQERERGKFSPADVSFMAGMIHHHAQAIVMSRLIPANTTNRSLQTLGGRIINAQRDEIAYMQDWLRLRGQTVPEVHITEDQVMVHGGGHDAHMPGMLTEEQMRQLREARGSQFDRLFLTFMIQHHQGAITMVKDLFATDGALQDEAAFKIASDIQIDQKTEIERMEKLLAALPAGAR